jgi:pimeloyl-ACP methyl ester carboxylesterase
MIDVMEPAFGGSGPWRRIYVDLPGHGLSPPQDDIRSQDDLLNSIVAFADEVLPDVRFAVVGVSRGSYIARGLACMMPERLTGVALILPGGNPSSDPGRLPPVQVLQEDPAIRPHLSDDEVWAHDNISVVQSWEIIEKRRRLIHPARALFDAPQEERVFANFDFSFKDREEATVFTGPSLIVAGRQDSFSGYLDAMDLMQRFPRSTLAVLDMAGHALAWERPELFHALVRDWLSRLGTT